MKLLKLHSRHYIFLYLLCIGIIAVSCNAMNNSGRTITHTEMDDPTEDTLSNWSGVEAGLKGSVVSIDIKHPRSILPEIDQINEINLTGWKGETLSAQVLLWNSVVTESVEYSFSDFRSGDNIIQSDIAKARFVRYTMSEEENFVCRMREVENEFGMVLMPDLLDSLNRFNMEPNQVRPVWLTIKIPSSASAGRYEGVFTVNSKNGDLIEFPISLNVQDRTLPPAYEWTYHLDLWQHPSAVARYAGLEFWSD